MMSTYLGDDADGLDGFEFLTMAEAGEVGHWAVLGKLNEAAGGEQRSKQLVELGVADPGTALQRGQRVFAGACRRGGPERDRRRGERIVEIATGATGRVPRRRPRDRGAGAHPAPEGPGYRRRRAAGADLPRAPGRDRTPGAASARASRSTRRRPIEGQGPGWQGRRPRDAPFRGLRAALASRRQGWRRRDGADGAGDPHPRARSGQNVASTWDRTMRQGLAEKAG